MSASPHAPQTLSVLTGGKTGKHGQGFAVLGEYVWWTVKGVMVSRADLTALMVRHGLDITHIPRKIRARTQVLRTLTEMVEDGFLRRIVEEPEHTIFVMVDETVYRSQESASYQISETFRYDKAAGTLTATNPYMQSRIDALMVKYAGSFLTHDLRQIIKDVVFSDAVKGFAARSDGGVYFVPDTTRGTLDRLAAMVSDLGPGCNLARTLLPAIPDNVATVGASYMDAFDAEVATAKAQIETLKAAGTARDSTIDKKLASLLELRQNAGAYTVMLSLDAARVDTELAALEASIMDLMLNRGA